MDIFESLAFLTKSKILMQKSHFLAVNHKRRYEKGDKTANVGQKTRRRIIFGQDMTKNVIYPIWTGSKV